MTSPDSPQIDPAMLELFQAEMDTHIPVLNQGLLALEKGQAGDRDVEAMMRAAHSIKGAARIVGIEPAVRVSHVMEDCFTAAKEKRMTLTSDAVDVLLAGVDALQRICAPLTGAPVSEEFLVDLVNRLAALKTGHVPPPAPIPPVAQGPTGLVAATVEKDEPGVTFPAVLDEGSAQSLRRELLDTLALNPARVQLDFAQVEQFGTAALAMLVSFAEQAGRKRPSPLIEARGLRPAVRAVLRVAGLDAVLRIDR